MAMDEESKLRRDIARGAGITAVRRLLALLEEKDWEPVTPAPSGRVREVAEAFIADLRANLSDEQLALAVERNRAEALDYVCHSHDFLDANECMDAAFRQVLGEGVLDGKEDGEIEERKNALWTEAWDLAREAEFDVRRLGWRRRSAARRRRNPRDPRDQRRLRRAAARGDEAAKARLEAEEAARIDAVLARHGISERDVEEFFGGYLEGILFSENDQSDPETGGEPLDRNYGEGDFDEAFVEKAKRLCRRFVAENAVDLIETLDMAPRSHEWTAWSHHGYDLWMTSRGHGVGFWDRGYGGAGERLSQASEREPYGDVEHCAIFVENGKVYVD